MSLLKKIFPFLFILAGLAGSGCDRDHSENRVFKDLDRYNVRWDKPGGNSLGSMPLGNGDIGLNVWVEDSGDVCFYISKTDAWDENARLVKIGGVRVQIKPVAGELPAFANQELDLKTGSVRIRYGSGKEKVEVIVWVDAGHPVVDVDVKAGMPVELLVKNEMWRVRKDTLASIGHGDIMYDSDFRNGLREPVIVDPDSILRGLDHAIGWYHYNSRSVGPALTGRWQGITDIMIPDPLLHRIFGAVITGEGAGKKDDMTLFLPAGKERSVMVYVLTLHPATPEKWLQAVTDGMDRVTPGNRESRWEAHKKWWHDLWHRSYIFLTAGPEATAQEDSNAFVVTRGYTLQRFISACAGRGAYPIKFNGSIFTMNFPGSPGGPDYRRWGPAYWWQNTRLPYISMCASGDFEMMHPLFKMYVDDLSDFFRRRTKRYLGHDGLYMTEEMYIWGALPMATYGWDSTFAERKDKLQRNGYHKYEWVSSLELLYMMLDYYDYTGDRAFLEDKVLPFAREALTFFDRHYPDGPDGKMLMHPSQALETWWDCTDPMPEIAGLYADTKRLLRLDTALTTAGDRAFWERLRTRLPEIPLREENGVTMLAPARSFADRHNVERPEMYAVFPFRLYGIGKPHPEYAKAAMENHWQVAHGGWSQDDIFYAYMGETEKAKNAVVERAKGKDPRVRFPAFWGPNYDWTPDQDHGGVLMKAVQSLLLQTDDNTLRLFPAWPGEWNVRFKLHAPENTVIEGEYRDGKLKDLKVTPDSRRADIINMLSPDKNGPVTHN